MMLWRLRGSHVVLFKTLISSVGIQRVLRYKKLILYDICVMLIYSAFWSTNRPSKRYQELPFIGLILIHPYKNLHPKLTRPMMKVGRYSLSSRNYLRVTIPADFDSKLDEAGDKLVVIDFHATWCGPCKAIAPYIQDLSVEYNENVMFLKVDVDENEDIAGSYNVTCMPTFIFLKKKAKVDEFSGANKEKLKELVEKHK